jgi:hypothetical protein
MKCQGRDSRFRRAASRHPQSPRRGRSRWTASTHHVVPERRQTEKQSSPTSSPGERLHVSPRLRQRRPELVAGGVGATEEGRCVRGRPPAGWRLEAIFTDNGSEFVPCARAPSWAPSPSRQACLGLCPGGGTVAGGPLLNATPPARADAGSGRGEDLGEVDVLATESERARVSALTGFGLASSQMATA